MSAHPPLDRSALADRWPTPSARAALAALPVDHAVDIAFLFASSLGERSDALLAETRRHLAGCLRSVETALRLSLGGDPRMAEAIGQLRDPLCWPTLCARPGLIGPALLRHMRMRAATGLILRQSGRGDEGAEGVASSLFDESDPRLSEATALLAIAEGRWAAIGHEDQPMRPDLPAERFAELLWLAVAILAEALEPAMPPGGRPALAILTEAGHALLARHDEAAGPLAAADRLVSRLGEEADDPGLRARAIGQRRLLLFAALGARRLRMEMAAVVDLLLTEPVAHIAAFCTAMGASGVELRHLLLTLQPARPSLTDMAVLAQAERYGDGASEQAEAVMALLRAPPLLRASLEQMRAMPGR